MPFIERVTSLPPLNQITDLEQIVIVDQSGPNIPTGTAPTSVCVVGEFLKGPFTTAEATSGGNLLGIWGGFSADLSQDATGVQNAGGKRFEGNGIVALYGKSFQRLSVQRVDMDAVSASAGTVKASLQFSVTVDASDLNPTNSGLLGRDLLIPAGTRFADNALFASATVCVKTSQDIVLPAGTAVSSGSIVVNASTPNVNTPNDGQTGATCYFILGITAASAVIDACIDTVLPNSLSTISETGISTVNASNAATAIFPPGASQSSLTAYIEAAYLVAIGKTLPHESVTNAIGVIWSARRGTTASIRTALQTNAQTASANNATGRICIVSGPRIGTVTGDSATVALALTQVETVTPTESPGRSDCKIVTFVYVQQYINELSQNIIVAPDSWMACSLSNFPNEVNPGMLNPYIQNIADVEPAYKTTPLQRQDYINLKAAGVATLQNDPVNGWWFASGVTSVDPSVNQNLAPIKRRRMANEVEAELAILAGPYVKAPAVDGASDSLVDSINAYLDGLLNPPSGAPARIEGYLVDPTSGNTDQLQAIGVDVIKVYVRLIASRDQIVFNVNIGETVVIPVQQVA